LIGFCCCAVLAFIGAALRTAALLLLQPAAVATIASQMTGQISPFVIRRSAWMCSSQGFRN
jgi:hypothetical protein